MEYLRTAINDFIQDGQRRLSPCTQTYYRSALNAFAAYCAEQGVDHIGHVTRPLVRAYATSLDTQLSPGGAHARLRALRVFINWAMREELIEKNPIPHSFFPKVPQPELPVVSEDDMQMLLRAADESTKPLRNRAILLTLFDTGLRASELCGLHLSHLLADGTLYVRLGKGAKDRRVPISKLTRRAIQQYVNKERPESERTELFLSNSCQHLTASGLAQLVERLSKAAGVADKTPHAFRRGFAVSFIKHGADLLRLRDVLGHTTIAMSTRYAVMSPDDLKELHQDASPVSHLQRRRSR